MSQFRIPAIAISLLALTACGDPGIFARVAPPESGDVAAADYPRLADVPEAPPAGVHDAAAPDPAAGAAIRAELAAQAKTQQERRKEIEGPVE